MRYPALAIGALLGCGDAPAGSAPYVVVHKLDGYERRMSLDERGLYAFAGSGTPTAFTVTMETYTDGALDAIFVRELRDGAWLSSSPTPGTLVTGEPRIAAGCDDCHVQNAEQLGMFTLAAAREAVLRGATAHIECATQGTEPCSTATYRELQWAERSSRAR